jgi:superfamily II DNA or RNA helicase
VAAIPDQAVRSFFDPSLLALFELIDSHLMDGDRLRNLAQRLLDPQEILKNPSHRRLLIEMLPAPKRQEMARRVDVSADSSVQQISDAIATKAQMAAALEFFGIEPEVHAPIEAPPATKRIIPQYALFKHQLRLVNSAWKKLEAAPHTVIVHMPTGGGKTRSAMHLIAEHLRSYNPSLVIWLANSRELLEQAASEFDKSWSILGDRSVDLVRMWGDFDSDPLSVRDGVVVAGLQKLYYFKQNRFSDFLRLADRAHLTVVDEAHIAVAPTYHDLITSLCSKRHNNRLLGLTATPGRTWADIALDRELSDLFNSQKVSLEIEGYSNPVAYLIDEGYLARPTFTLLNTEPGLSLSSEEHKALADRFEVTESLLERLGDTPTRNLKIVERINDLITRHRRIIVFAPSVASAKSINAVLNVQGVNSLCITADTDIVERQKAIDLYKSDTNDPIVLLNYGVFAAGFDAPKTSAAVIGRPTLSLVLYSQMVGRALRGPRAGGNADAEIVTVVDPELPGFGKVEEAFRNWEDVWDGTSS